MAMYTLKGIGEISTDAFDEKITLRNLLQPFRLYDFIIVDKSFLYFNRFLRNLMIFLDFKNRLY